MAMENYHMQHRRSLPVFAAALTAGLVLFTSIASKPHPLRQNSESEVTHGRRLHSFGQYIDPKSVDLRTDSPEELSGLGSDGLPIIYKRIHPGNGGEGFPGTSRPYKAKTDETHAVRCCSDEGMGPGWSKKTEGEEWCPFVYTFGESEYCPIVTFWEADEICASKGGRICAPMEIMHKCAVGFGCGFDLEFVWTKEKIVGNEPELASTDTAPLGIGGGPLDLDRGIIDFTRADGDSCLRARKYPTSSYQNLEKPFINLGFPKMGTTSLYSFFLCGRVPSTHWVCGKKGLWTVGKRGKHIQCAQCIKEAFDAGHPPLSQCPKRGDAWLQIDGTWGVRGPNGKSEPFQFFPQIEMLEEIVQSYPRATYLLTFRSMEKWYRSLVEWTRVPKRNREHKGINYAEHIKMSNITGSPTMETPPNVQEFSEWFCHHVERVRNVIAQYPDATLVEVDIEDPETPQRMHEIFGFKEKCWGHKNANAVLTGANE